MILKAPFPWFGGKSRIAREYWRRVGRVQNFVDPFMGSNAILLGRPEPIEGIETVNDASGMLANFWRAIRTDPLKTALEADLPVEETFLHAAGDAIFYRDEFYSKLGHGSYQEFHDRLDREIDFCDCRIAGLWVWGQCAWIGDNWGRGAHNAKKDANCQPCGVTSALPHLGNAGQGVNRKLPHLGNAGKAWLDSLSYGPEIVQVLALWPTVTERTWMLFEYFAQLAARLRNVRVCCGDWSRVCTETPTVTLGSTAVFLDPPYSVADRDCVYGEHESYTVAADVRAWCLEHGNDPLLRIAYCGYAGEGDCLEAAGWDTFAWKTSGGYASQNRRGNENRHLERVWFSPRCISANRLRQEVLPL